MADEIREVRETVTTEPTVPVVPASKATTVVASASRPGLKVERIIYFITGALMVLLGARVVLSLLGANRGNAFAELIYGITYPLVAPFFGLFGYEFEYGVNRLEIETLFAMAVYATVGWGIAKLIRIART